MAGTWDRRSDRERARTRSLLLSTWLPQVTTYSPFWAEEARALDLEPRRLGKLEDLQRFRTVRENDVLDGWGGAGLLMRPTEDEVKALADRRVLMGLAGAIRSGGGAGKRLRLLEEFKPVHVHEAGADGALAVAYSRSDLDRLHRTGWRAAQVLGLTAADQIVSALPYTPTLQWWGTYHLAMGSSILGLHPRTGRGSLREVLHALALGPATAVVVRAEDAADLALTLTDHGISAERVRTVVVVGPTPYGDDRSEVEAAWRGAGAPSDLRIRRAWAPSAGRALWAECETGQHGLHTYPDLEVLEVVDPLTGIPSESEGDLTYTSAGWHGTALLRFQTGAYVDGIVDGPCPGCGRNLPRIEGEIAPTSWQLRAATGSVDLRGVAAVLASEPRIETWRAELGRRADGSEVLRVELAGQLSAGPDQLGARLRAATGAPAVEVEQSADAVLVDRRAEELGSVFADVR